MRILAEDRGRGGSALPAGLRRVQYGAAFDRTLTVVCWMESDAGTWSSSQVTLPADATRALTRLLNG